MPPGESSCRGRRTAGSMRGRLGKGLDEPAAPPAGPCLRPASSTPGRQGGPADPPVQPRDTPGANASPFRCLATTSYFRFPLSCISQSSLHEQPRSSVTGGPLPMALLAESSVSGAFCIWVVAPPHTMCNLFLRCRKFYCVRLPLDHCEPVNDF